VKPGFATKIFGGTKATKWNTGDGAAKSFGKSVGKGSFTGTDQTDEADDGGTGGAEIAGGTKFENRHVLQNTFFYIVHAVVIFVEDVFDSDEVNGTFDPFGPGNFGNPVDVMIEFFIFLREKTLTRKTLETSNHV